MSESRRRDVLGWLRQRYLTLDPRWLGVFRIALGTLLTVDIARRWYYARAFYTNEGLLPNHFAIYRPMGRNVFSIFFPFSTLGEVSVLFALSLVAAVLFTIGYRTKLFHILSAIVITSLNARNIFVENGGTVVVNVLTVWALFLPLGRRLSVDAVLRSLREFREQSPEDLRDHTRPERSTRGFASLVVLALLLQWTAIYFFNAVHKSGQGWMNGSAIHWFWHQDRIVTLPAIWLREHAPMFVIKGTTYGTLAMEFVLGFILLVPIFQTWTRRIAFLLALALHGGIAFSSRLGPFSYVMVIYFLMLFGERDWQLAARAFGRPTRARTVIYDADCGICFQICRILKRFDPFDRLTFVANTERELIPDSLDDATLDPTVVAVMPDGSIVTEERAVFEIVRALPLGILLVWWMRVPGLSRLARLGYRKIADKRMRISSWFGLGVCGVPLAVAGAGSAGEGSVVVAMSPPVRETQNETEPEPAPSSEPKPDAALASETETEPREERAAQSREESREESGDDKTETAAGDAEAEGDEPREETEEPEETEAAAEARDKRASEPALEWYGANVLEPPIRREIAATTTFVREVAVALLILAMGSQLLMENRYVHRFFRAKQPEWAAYVVHYPRTFQGWGMFAPEPPYDDGHVVVDGRTVDGRQLDPQTGKVPNFDPYAPRGWDHGQFQCDYENRIRFPGNGGYRPFFRDWLLNHHRRTGNPNDQLVAFDVWWVGDKSPPPGQLKGEPLPPAKILSHGFVKDSLATPWLGRRQP